MLDEHVELLEGAVVQQQLDALARRELALRMLGRDALLATAEAGDGPALLQLFKNVLHGLANSRETCRQCDFHPG